MLRALCRALVRRVLVGVALGVSTAGPVYAQGLILQVRIQGEQTRRSLAPITRALRACWRIDEQGSMVLGLCAEGAEGESSSGDGNRMPAEQSAPRPPQER